MVSGEREGGVGGTGGTGEPRPAHGGRVSLQGKQKKARKYAVMKRMISLRDQRM